MPLPGNRMLRSLACGFGKRTPIVLTVLEAVSMEANPCTCALVRGRHKWLEPIGRAATAPFIGSRLNKDI